MPDNDIDLGSYNKGDYTLDHLESYMEAIIKPAAAGSEIVNVQMCVTSFYNELRIAEMFRNVTLDDVDYFRQKADAFMSQPQNKKLYQAYFSNYLAWWEDDKEENQTK